MRLGCAPFQRCLMPDSAILFQSLRVLSWMGAPVLLGFILWRYGLKSRTHGHDEAARLSRGLGRIALLGAAGPLMLLVVWVAPLPAGTAVSLPLVGLIVHATGSLAGWGCAGLLGEPRRRHGVFLLAGGCSNVLTFGSITIVLLLGSPEDPQAEHALGVMAIYRLAELPFYFLVAWPVSAVVSGAAQGAAWGTQFRKAVSGPSIVPILGILGGGALNLLGVERPDGLQNVTQFLVRINVVLLGMTVGLSLRNANPARALKPCWAISVIKFVMMPGLALGMALALGLRGSTLQVIVICSSMPVAFMAVLGAILYRLDDELVGSFWLFTTAAMIVVVPVLAMVMPLLGAIV